MNTLQTQMGIAGHKARGFTLIGLLVVIVTLAFLALLIWPTLGRSRAFAEETICLNNMRQLMVTALMYADDNKGLWFPNQPSGEANQQDWVTDNMDWGSITVSEPPPFGGLEATNWQLLLANRAQSPQAYSMFAPYIRNPLVYKCPADPSQVHGTPRARTYSANAAVGTLWTYIPGCNSYPDGPVTGQWLSGSLSDSQNYGRTYQKTSQMNRPNPAHLWIFEETHPDDINDSSDQVQIADTSLGGSFIDYPSDLHAGAAPYSFADGHAEMHQWLGFLRAIPFVNGGPLDLPGSGAACVNTPDLKDLNWLQSRTSCPINPSIPYLTPEP